MRLRDIMICLLCVVMTVALLTTAVSRLDYINTTRSEMRLISNEPLENAPPSLAFATVAMGAFRGLVVDILWLRAEKLKEQGQFFDAKQLAEWITTLQPRFTSVWAFQAWNMAYNISVTMPATEPYERWRWIRNGMELLRDKGIPKNPKAIILYRELAWIFQHKMGGLTDDAHRYYKLQLSRAMKPLLGPQTNEYFQTLAQAPTKWPEIMREPGVKQIVEALRTSDKAFANEDKFVGNYLALRQTPTQFDSRCFDVIDHFRGTDALEKLDVFAKACELRNTWKLDIGLMVELNRKYSPNDWNDPNKHCPLNWEHPDSHAIYWAVKGLKVASKKNEYTIDEINTDRIVYHSLQNLFRYGKIIIYPVPVEPPEDSRFQTEENKSPLIANMVFLHPDLRMFIPYNKAALAIIEKYKQLKGNVEALQNGHRNMLKNAVLLFYQAGHINYARKVYNQLKKLYPRDEFKVPLAVYCRNQIVDELQNLDIKDATEIIQAVLREAYYHFALHEDDEAFGREKMAKEIYDNYQKVWTGEKVPRVDLPDFKVLRYLALKSFLNDELYPPNMRRSLLIRIKVERPKLFDELQQQQELLMKKAAEEQ